MKIIAVPNKKIFPEKTPKHFGFLSITVSCFFTFFHFPFFFFMFSVSSFFSPSFLFYSFILHFSFHNVVIGGTSQLGNWNINSDEEDKKRIIKDCARLIPSLEASLVFFLIFLSIICGSQGQYPTS